MQSKRKEQGYSFVEVLVAITILLVGLVGPLTIASTGLRNAAFAREQTVAFFLAQEGIEGILYLRERAGLQNISGSGSSWGWVSSLPSACFSGSACRIDLSSYTVSVCNPVSACDLNLYSSGTLRYRHGSGGVDTPYRRLLYFENTNSRTLRVRSVVEWHANAFGGTRSVSVETYLTDIYAN